MDEKKKIKICFAASSGGHYEQLMMLKPLMKKYDSFVITEKTDYSAESKGEKTYYMKQVNRREKRFYMADDSKYLEVYQHLQKRKAGCSYLHRRFSDDSDLPYFKAYG